MEYETTEQYLLPAAPTTTETGMLVQRAQAGDPHAFDTLVRRFQDMAVGYSAAMLGDFHLAEDAAQEAFLETYRILPTLRVPDAFPAYLRLTLRKYCDRITRRKQVPTVGLEAAIQVSGARGCVSETLVARERQTVVRDAVRALPESERIAIVLFYIGQRSHKEVAAFLNVPLSTVKNRLHAARRRLRERMLDTMKATMEETMEETLREQRPSKNDRFRGQIISRLFDTYRQQFRADPQTADSALLTQAREELQQAIAENALDAETVHVGALVLILTNNFRALPELMDRYLTQPLGLAEEFWARWTRIRGLASPRIFAAAVESQRAFIVWIRDNITDYAAIRLSAQGAYAPTGDSSEETLSPDTLPLFVLGIDVGDCFRLEGRLDEWLAIRRETMDSVPKTATNRFWRMVQIRDSVRLLALQNRSEEAIALTEAIRALSDEEADWQAPRWTIESLIMETMVRSQFFIKDKKWDSGDQKNSVALRVAAEEAIRQLTAFAAQPGMDAAECDKEVKLLASALAAPLTSSQNYDLALPLWERIQDERLHIEWSYIRYAECVWAVTKDRQRTLALLRKAVARVTDDRLPNRLWDWFQNDAEGFADVREDAEFSAAIIRPTAANQHSAPT